MLNNIVNQATTPGGILAFILGIGTALVYQGLIKPWYCKRHGINLKYKISFRLTNLIIIIMVMSFIWTGSKLVDLTNQVAECQKQFNVAIVGSRHVAEQNDDLSVEQRLIVFNWLHDIVFPPLPYANMSVDDERRQQWGLSRTITADREFKSSIDRQSKVIDSRPPLPDPTCGRE